MKPDADLDLDTDPHYNVRGSSTVFSNSILFLSTIGIFYSMNVLYSVLSLLCTCRKGNET